MNVPKSVKDYCGKCKTHTEHKLKLFKAAMPRSMAWGTRHDLRKYKKGYGGKSRFTAIVKKQTKKPTFIAECAQCKAKHYLVVPKRMKRVELKSV